MSGELPESKQTQNLGSSPVNLQLSPNFGHICGWSLRRATAMLHTQGKNIFNHFTSMDMLKRSYFIISATKVGSKRLQQMWWRHLQKANSVSIQTGSTWWEIAHVIPDRRQQTDTASQPKHKDITVWTSAWAGPKQITGGETLALTSSSYKTNKWMQTHLLQINILKHIHTLKVFLLSLYDKKKEVVEPESMWQWPIAWMVCWLCPLCWLKKVWARLCALRNEVGSEGSQRFTISLTVKRAW